MFGNPGPMTARFDALMEELAEYSPSAERTQNQASSATEWRNQMSEVATAYADERLRDLLIQIACGEVFTTRSVNDLGSGRRMRRRLKQLRNEFGIDSSVARYVELLIEGAWAVNGQYDLGNPGARKCALDALAELDALSKQAATNDGEDEQPTTGTVA